MARVTMGGETFNVDLVKDNGNGTWMAKSRQHTGRTSPGTMLTVSQSEIIEAAAAELPEGATLPANAKITGAPTVGSAPSASEGLADLEAGMAKERETLPSPADLIKQHRAALSEAGKLGEQRDQSAARP